MKNRVVIAAYLPAFIIFLSALAIPALIRDAQLSSFDVTERNTLAAENPDFILMGNSALNSRMDYSYLAEKLKGSQVTSLVHGGDMSALWYLIIKNVIIPSGVKPKRTLIFFTDHDLTNPMARTKPLFYRKKIAVQSMPEEPFLKKIFASHATFIEKVYDASFRIYPVQDKNNVPIWYMDKLSLLAAAPEVLSYYFQKKISGFTPESRAKGWDEFTGPNVKFIKDRLQETFHMDGLRPSTHKELSALKLIHKWDFYPGLSAAEFDFSANLNNSFLPEMIRLAKKHDLNLGFLYYQRKPGADGQVYIPEPVARYRQDLFQYFDQQGVYYHDFLGDPKITQDFYLTSVHIYPENKVKYTDIFVDRLAEVFQ
jgi:hypothetical protein